MDIYGIKNITKNNLEFNYDVYYKNFSLKLKEIENEEKREELKTLEHINFSNTLKIEINVEEVKENFIELLLDENSPKFLWLLYSKYNNKENYIEKISNILKMENTISRIGTNTYKVNGWMTHSLYVYQIVNYNIPNNIEIKNFNGDLNSKKELSELHQIYSRLSKEGKFVLKIFSLIHDIGVIENVQFHDKLGSKYVSEALEEIGLTQEKLELYELNIKLEDLIKTLKNLIKYHTLISLVSGESSDEYIEFAYKDLISSIPDIYIKIEIPKILFLLAFADIIAVDESLMDTEKYKRTKQGYLFFEEISKGKANNRNKEKVALERINDVIGKISYEYIKNNINSILDENNINKNEFLENMYNLRLMKYTGPLMKFIDNFEITIKIFDSIFRLISSVEGRENIRKYVITFVPDKPEYMFLEAINNGTFFDAVQKAQNNKTLNIIHKNLQLENGVNELGNYLNIKIID